MKKTNNKKGFTIVELIIVIAVIAILAAVLIPTFSGVIKKANESAALQEASALYKEAYAVAISDGKIGDEENSISISISDVTPAVTHYYEVQPAGDLSFVFISEDGSVENLTVKVCKKADNITVTGAGTVNTTNNTTTYTYTCKTSPSVSAEAGEIDGYYVTVENGAVEVSETAPTN